MSAHGKAPKVVASGALVFMGVVDGSQGGLDKSPAGGSIPPTSTMDSIKAPLR
jgi:hypothetical protein